MQRRKFLLWVTAIGVAILNVAGLVAIASGSASLGRLSTASPGSEPEIQIEDPRYDELRGESLDGSHSGIREAPEKLPENDPLPSAGSTFSGVESGPAPVAAPAGAVSPATPRLRTLLDRASLDLEEAGNVALDQSGGRLVEAALESSDGDPVYEIEALGEDGNLKGFRVDGRTGSILSREIKSNGDSDEALYLLRSVKIDQEQLERAVSGVAPGELTRVALKSHDGAPVFEVETLAKEDKLYKVRVDARSGAVISYGVLRNAPRQTAKAPAKTG
ncbi:Peptidase propeptide and YPEB domain [Rubrobacter radiotolerans]|uniref:PepSY domain-containing protein n=1 Tax=Rubrobacter radiotolerans TaxID=42256 RepID=A0A023X018_RUBRA|nr:PepSY domain-containing protein [Rubrobacter radiotolerans]AHY45531.1 Peptidase propeptide and YPEB domain [Rubrobacter radiotolerans]MDX5892943.1 PepSY domain-containing protein [Rubrobacter radiotolerans]SMC02791.1 Uncharacterized membrane protein YkoI [Rubrobacter radiotolerans DSM 5868]